MDTVSVKEVIVPDHYQYQHLISIEQPAEKIFVEGTMLGSMPPLYIKWFKIASNDKLCHTELMAVVKFKYE